MTVLLLAAFALPAAAQSVLTEEDDNIPDREPNAIEKIMESSFGNVEIIGDEDLLQKILTPPESHRKSNGQRPLRQGINKMAGFRIQVFADGRNQHSLESRAKARGSAIIAKFPKYRGQVYTFSSSPNWYTRVGNFRSAAEAENALQELKRAFPAFASEMRVVKSQIVIVR